MVRRETGLTIATPPEAIDRMKRRLLKKCGTIATRTNIYDQDGVFPKLEPKHLQSVVLFNQAIMASSDQQKLLSALAHGAIFFSSLLISIGIPIAILFISDDPLVKANARESINFHINLYIYAIIFGLLAFVVIGIPLLIILGAVSFIMPIIAIIHCLTNVQQPYRYPFILRLL
jgi:uncharacterized protein